MKKLKKVSKFFKQRKYAILAVFVSLVILTGAIAKAADVSFWDKIVQATSDKLAVMLTSEIGGQIELTPVPESFGATPGPTSTGNCVSAGGIETCSYSTKMKTSTTTPCAFKVYATSTLVYHSYGITLASSTVAVKVTIAQAASAFATTTQIGSDFTIPLSTQAMLIGSSTSQLAFNENAGTSALTFAPNTYLVMGMQAAGNGETDHIIFSPTGTCKAEFKTN